MKAYLHSFFKLILFFTAFPFFAQQGVGINTTNLADGSALQIESTTGALVLPRMTIAQMEQITNVLDGAIVFNTTDRNWYIRIDGSWRPYANSSTPSIILNKEGQTLTQSALPLPIPLSSANVVQFDQDYYKVLGSPEAPQNATIKILRDGLYLVTAGMSTINLPPGAKKYRMILYVNDKIVSYLTTGNVNLQGADYWGTSGNSVVLVNENDVITVKYTLDGTGNINGKFFNIAISKL